MPWSLFTGQRGQPAPGEPAWTEDDVEAALAYQEWRDSICGGCGNPLEESMARESDGAYSVTVLVCHGCKAREEAVHAAQERGANIAGRRYLAVLDDRR